MRKLLLSVFFLMIPFSVWAWTTTNHWTTATMGSWTTWNAGGGATSNITLSPAQPDGYTTTLRITTGAGTSSNDGWLIGGASTPFSSTNEMWLQYYLYYPSTYTFHPIGEKVSGWSANESQNHELQWEYGHLNLFISTDGDNYHPNAGYNPGQQKSHWYKMVEHVVINTPGVANGVFQLWVDDQMVHNHNNIKWNSASQSSGFIGVREFLVWGGQGGDITLGSDMYQYRGTTILSSSPIGSGGGAGIAPIPPDKIPNPPKTLIVQ